MTEKPEDPFKKIFQSLPEIEPSEKLKEKILEKIKLQGWRPEFWFLKPALVLSSLMIISVLGTIFSLSLSRLITHEYDISTSPTLRWAQTHSSGHRNQGVIGERFPL